jgi:hypothetical protein
VDSWTKIGTVAAAVAAVAGIAAAIVAWVKSSNAPPENC